VTLTELDLGGNRLLAEGAAVLTEGIKSALALTTVRLQQNSIGDDGVTLLSGVWYCGSGGVVLWIGRGGTVDREGWYCGSRG
jgi:Ran GTPase-activating protein (RanGAP) involved in mRNA processing and transport